MTASEARADAAAWRARAESQYFPEGLLGDDGQDEAAMYLRAAVALDAYADGIDRPETRGMLETADVFAKAAANHVPAVGSAPAIVAFYELERSQYALAATALRRCAAPEFLPTSADTNRLHRIRARLIALVPLDGTMSLADDVQRLDRALADARQHALLAALWTVCTPRELELKVPAALSPEAAEAFAHEIIDTVGAAIRDDLLALAKEVTDGP